MLLQDDKFKRGLYNELLISGNLNKKGLQTKVLNNHCPDYDIMIKKDEKQNFVECKLDAMESDNFYFEYWNYTYNRPTGINNINLNTLYSHTFRINNEWFYIINFRKYFIQIIKDIINKHPNKIRTYNKTYFIEGKLMGDKAYIVDKQTFLSYYSGKIHKLELSLKW